MAQDIAKNQIDTDRSRKFNKTEQRRYQKDNKNFPQVNTNITLVMYHKAKVNNTPKSPYGPPKQQVVCRVFALTLEADACPFMTGTSSKF